jgi:hypothetical protein
MVFVYEKSLIIIMFAYSVSFGILGMQFIAADTFHLQIADFNGNPLKNNIIIGLGAPTINAIETNSTCTTESCHSNAVNPITYLAVAAQFAWNLFLLITGLYIFSVLNELGIPLIFMVAFISLYTFLLVRSMMGWIRGI